MGEVIQFPIIKRQPFIEKMQNELCEDDYLDFIEGVTSPEIYEELDEDLQDLIDQYIMNGFGENYDNSTF